MDAGTETAVLKLKGSFGAEHGDKLSYLKGHKKEINDQCDSLSHHGLKHVLKQREHDSVVGIMCSRPVWDTN